MEVALSIAILIMAVLIAASVKGMIAAYEFKLWLQRKRK